MHYVGRTPEAAFEPGRVIARRIAKSVDDERYVTEFRHLHGQVIARNQLGRPVGFRGAEAVHVDGNRALRRPIYDGLGPNQVRLHGVRQPIRGAGRTRRVRVYYLERDRQLDDRIRGAGYLAVIARYRDRQKAEDRAEHSYKCPEGHDSLL